MYIYSIGCAERIHFYKFVIFVWTRTRQKKWQRSSLLFECCTSHLTVRIFFFTVAEEHTFSEGFGLVWSEPDDHCSVTSIPPIVRSYIHPFLQIIRVLNSYSPNQQRRPLPSLLSDPSSIVLPETARSCQPWGASWRWRRWRCRRQRRPPTWPRDVGPVDRRELKTKFEWIWGHSFGPAQIHIRLM